jgi:hypothetical protein
MTPENTSPGAHYMVLHGVQADLCTAYQIYENVTEGCPVSPVFDSGAKLVAWLVDQGVSPDAADAFLKQGFAPSFVIRSNGEVQLGIDGGKIPKGST